MIGYSLNDLYVGELDPSVTEEILFNSFSRFGRIMSLKVMRHIVTGISRGFAFINYFTPHEAYRAKNAMNGQKFFGKTLRVYLKSEYDSLDPDATIVFQNLSEDATEDQLLGMLSGFGIPFSVKIVKEDKTPGVVKAFVQYDKKETAKAVIDKFNNSERDGKHLVVELANKKNKVFIKAKYHESAVEELKKTLEAWKFEENETHEVSLDKAFFIIQLRFENEDTANKFLEDFRTNPGKCIFTRPNDFERC